MYALHYASSSSPNNYVSSACMLLTCNTIGTFAEIGRLMI